jgi:methylase of polypeptide subunit release factors
MKQLIKSGFKAIGYEIRRTPINDRRFTIGTVTYEFDPCSVGKEPQGELTGLGAIRMIRERGLRDLSILDICCGVGVIGLTIFSELGDESTVKKVAFSDINIFNLNSLRRTLKINNLDELLGDEISIWLSDSLSAIPDEQRFDLIVSNPPHFLSNDHTANLLSPNRLATYDANWSFHTSFYSECHKYLTERGEVWFLENGDAVTASELLPFIEANPNLEYVKEIVEPSDPTYFWMFSKRSSTGTPDNLS